MFVQTRVRRVRTRKRHKYGHDAPFRRTAHAWLQTDMSPAEQNPSPHEPLSPDYLVGINPEHRLTSVVIA